MHAWEGRGGAGTKEGCGIYASEKDDQSCLFLPCGIDESNGEIFINCFLVRLEWQLYGLGDDRKISYVTCCHECDK